MKDDDFALASRSNAAGWLGLVERCLVVIGGAAVFALMILSVSDALLRSFLNAPIFGANDYAQVLLSFVVAASLPACVIAGRLIAIDTLVLMMPKKLQAVFDWGATLLGFCALIYLSWRAFKSGGEAAMFGETTLLLQLPFGPSYYALAAGCFVSALLMFFQKVIR